MYRQQFEPISHTCYRTSPKGSVHLSLNSGWLVCTQWRAAVDVTMVAGDKQITYFVPANITRLLPHCHALVPMTLDHGNTATDS